MSKILVTGSAGLIGFHLAKRLLERGNEVIGLDNINNYYDTNLKYGRLKELGINREDINTDTSLSQSTKYKNHQFIKMDLSDNEGINKLFETQKFNTVVNLTAQAGVRYSLENPHVYIQSNIVGFLNILEGCRNHSVKNLVYASSNSVYGLNESQPFKITDTSGHQVSLYAATKKSN